MARHHNFKRQAFFALSVFIISNIIPTCSGNKPEIPRSFAMPSGPTSLQIISFAPGAISKNESVFVDVKGVGFQKGSRLVIKGFVVDDKYMRVVNQESLIVKVPKGVPAGKYPVRLKNPDGGTSNEVWFEVRS